MILLPFLAFLSWVLAFRRLGRAWLETAVASLAIFGATVSIASELQSLIGALTPGGSLAAWLIATGIGWGVARRMGPRAAAAPDPGGSADAAEWGTAGVLIVLTGVLAFLVAPNSYDGLSYHLVRVERWIQQGSLRPFATHDTRQLFMPAWPESAMLHFRLLSGSDRFANLVQWIGFVGSAGGAAVLARALGGGRTAAATAAVLVATLPMAVAQASGTQTDLIATWWAVTACAFGYRLLGPAPRAGDAMLSAVGLALAVATKQTAALFGLVALAPAVVLVALRETRRLWILWMGSALLAVVLLAGPHLLRNAEVFGDLRGDTAWLSTVSAAPRGPNEIVSRVLRNLSVHFGTPWHGVNQAVVNGVRTVSRAIGADPDDPRTTWATPFQAIPWNTHEEAAPNPIHLLLIGACALAAIVSRRRRRIALLFLAALTTGFVVFCALLKWQSYSGRLHLPLFALGLAWAAVELERMNPRGRRMLLGFLFVAALPSAIFNYTRPLVRPAGFTVTPHPSIFSIPRTMQYFLYMPELAVPYRDVALRIVDDGCKDVGVRARPDAWEYTVIAVARNAGSTTSFRSVDVTNMSARFAGAASPPCLLLQIGIDVDRPPGWAANWRRLAYWQSTTPIRSIALFAPQ